MMINDNFDSDETTRRQALDEQVEFMQGISVNLSPEQFDDIKTMAARIISEVTVERLRRLTNSMEYFGEPEAMQYLNIDLETLNDWVLQGMPYFEIGGIVRFYRVDLDMWLEQFRVAPDMDYF